MKKFTLLLSFTLCMVFTATGVFAQTILSADFETGQPAGWAITTNASDGGWLFGTSTQLQSSSFPINPHTKMACSNDDGCDCDKSVDYLITPSMDLTAYTNVFLSFDSYYFNATYQGATEVATIEVSTDNGVTWTVANTVAGGADWTSSFVDLSAYAGQSNVKVAFHYNDDGGWLYGWALDNVSIYAPIPGVDISVSNLIVGKMDPTPAFVGFTTYLSGLPLTPQVTVTNAGTVAITSFDLTWSDGVNTHTQSLSGVNIAPLTSYTFNTTDTYLTLAGNTDITASVSNVNGGAVEVSTTNNSLDFMVNGVTANPDKKYLAEEATGTWCGWCPRGTVFMAYMRDQYPDQFVGIAAHDGDPMTVTDYDNGITSFPNFYGFPSVISDRNAVIDPSQLEGTFLDEIQMAPAVKVSATATLDNSNNLTVVVTGDFLSSLNGDYRFNAIVVEDSVHGTSSGYKQSNYYAGNAAGPMGGFESMPSEIAANSMYYMEVGRELLGGFDGTSGSLPASINAGDSYSYTYTYAVPATINVNKMWVAVMVLNNATGEVMNVNNVNWTAATGIDDVPANASVYVYPNPASDVAYIDVKMFHASDVTLQLTNTLGQVVASYNYPSLSDDQILPINVSGLATGYYNVQLTAGDQMITKRLMVNNE